MSRKMVIRIALGVGAVLGAASPALARPYTLVELVELARKGNPGIAAGGAAAMAMEWQVIEAHRNWYPSGELLSFVAPVPKIDCAYPGRITADPQTGIAYTRDQREDNCVTTGQDPLHNPSILTNLKGAWTRTELRLVQPLWDFGKISAGVAAAEAGVAALREKQAGTASDVEMNVRRAYWGLKLARELSDTLAEGTEYVEQAQKKIDKQLEAGTGNVTVTDKLRLRTVRAEVDARTLETKRLAELALNGLRTLLGPATPTDLDVDDAPFDPIAVPVRPVSYYEDHAKLNRPEVRALDQVVKAKHSLSDLERRRAYPDLVLIGTASFAYAPTIDVPRSTFVSNPFNSLGAGIAAALRMQLDLGPKLARADRVHAEAEEMDWRRDEALGGIALEVRKSYGEVTEATARVEALRKGERAGKAWVTATAQNFALGLAEARDFSDALLAFFQMRARFLQSVYDLNVAVAALSRATGAPVP
jgi:outer membrane protein TolC